MSDSYKQIGEVLTATRKEQNKELADLAESTKIMERYLAALEAGDPSQLPSPTYFLLFARSYAQNLGLDPGVIDEMADRDVSAANGGLKEPEAEPKEPLDEKARAKQSNKYLIIFMVVLIVVIGSLLVYNFALIEKEPELSSPAEDKAATIETEQDLTNLEKAGLNIEPYQPAPPLKMHLAAKQDVWTMVVRDGDTILNRELKAGEQRRWEAKYRYQLTIGISTAVNLTLNGEEVAPLSDRPRTISNLEINQINYKDFLLVNNPVVKRPPVEAPKTTSSPPEVQPENQPVSQPLIPPDSGTGDSGNGN
ncbi:MAG: DUF4115 domain-containing protein [candidate division Zixibacteria bacterium]|nr:DUF4115 domain-containing protein [candidate division Zixibacteria bacterium]